jgi:macrolide-specific efflux system membrane fusion protein
VLVTLVQQVDVPAQEAGVIRSVAVKEGQLVEEGELLAKTDDTEPRLAEARARIELENARKQAENRIQVRYAEKARDVASAELKRATDSLARYPKSISDTEIDRLRLAAEKAALAVEQAEFDFELAQYAWRLCEQDCRLAAHKLERCRITAPIAGVVVEANRQEGEWVEPKETVFRILRIDRLRAEGFLQATDLVGDLVGRSVTVHVQLPGQEEREFAGQLVFVSPEISPVNGQVRIFAEIENRGLLLRPGLRGRMTIERRVLP